MATMRGQGCYLRKPEWETGLGMGAKYDPWRHRRRSIRLSGYDYARPGVYFVTVCTWHREPMFGDIVDGEMRLNEFGEIASDCWKQILEHFPATKFNAFAVMPNHVRGIVIITGSGGARHAVHLHDIREPPLWKS